MDVPRLSADGVQTKLVSHLWSCHGTLDVLFVCVNEDNCVLQLFVVYHFVQLLSSVIDSVSVVGINNEDDALGVGVVMSPQLSDLVLTTDVPNVERDVFVAHLLHVETNCGDWCDYLTKLELVENSSFSCCVQADHENSHLDVSEHSLPDA